MKQGVWNWSTEPVQEQPGLPREILSQKKKQIKKQNKIKIKSSKHYVTWKQTERKTRTKELLFEQKRS